MSGGQDPGWVPDPSGQQEYRRSRQRFYGFLLLGLTIVMLAGLAAGLLLADDDASTSSSSPSGDRELTGQDLVNGLSDGIYEAADGALRHEETDCAAEAVVQGIGPSRLRELGIGDGSDGVPLDEMSDSEERLAVTWMYDCISDERLAGYITELGPVDETYEGRRCLAEGEIELLGADRIRELYVEFTLDPEVELFMLLDERERGAFVVLEQECFGSGSDPS